MSYVAYMAPFNSFLQNEVPMSDSNDHPSTCAEQSSTLAHKSIVSEGFSRIRRKDEITKCIHALYRNYDSFADTEEKELKQHTC